MTLPRHSNPEVEKTVIGALLDAEGMLRSSVAEVLAKTGLQSDDFAHPGLRVWFGAVAALSERGRPVDPTTVWGISKGMRGVPADGFTRLEQLAGGNACNLPALVEHSRGLRRLALLRKQESFLVAQLEKVRSEAADPSLVASDMDAFGKSLIATEDDFTTGDLDYIRISEEWDAAIRGVRLGYLPTGIEVLDGAITGWPENLSILCGGSSIGKSSLTAIGIESAQLAGHKIAVFGLEDGTQGVAERLVAKNAHISVEAVGTFRLPEYQMEDVQRVMGEGAALAQKHMLCWSPRDGERITSSRLIQLCRKAILVHRVRAIVIDHGLEIEHEGKHRGEELRARVDRTFSALRGLAFHHHVPIIVVVHLNREGSKQVGPPTQEQLAECASIERLARLILALWRQDSDADDEVRCSVLKRTKGARNIHLMLKRDLRSATISRRGGCELDLRAEKQAAIEAKASWKRNTAKGGSPWESEKP